jgi:hypothetical protein
MMFTPSAIRHPKSAFASMELLAVVVIAVLAGQADARGAKDFYVSITGSDSGAGTLASPYKTIQQAANAATQSGDRVFVRDGTYRETVTVQGSGVSFQPYNNEAVTITGLDPLGSGWTPYTNPLCPTNHSIYQATAANGASQVFMGGKPMIDARSSITPAGTVYNNPLRQPFQSGIDETENNGDTWKFTSSAITEPSGTWNGGRLCFAAKFGDNSGVAFSSDAIQSQAGNVLTCYQNDDLEGWFRPVPGQSDQRFYIYGSPAAVNSPKEWCYNSSKVYLQTPDGLTPNNRPSGQNVEVRTRQYGFDVNGKSNVNISGFKLQAASVNLSGSYNQVNNCQILYPCPYTDATTDRNKNPPYSTFPGVLVSGQHNTVSGSEIGYSWGDGVSITGSNNVISNNVIHDCNYSATSSSSINAMTSSGGNLIRNNTVYNDGSSSIYLGAGKTAANNQLLHNDVSRFGRLTNDLGGIYAWNDADSNSVIAYNKFHDCRDATPFSAGIYIDDGSSGFTVHHNLVTDCPSNMGIHVKGASENVYNNTIWNVDRAVVCENLTGAVNTVNNLSNAYESYGTYSSSNRHQTVDQFTNLARGDYTLTANDPYAYDWPFLKRARDYGVPISDITYPGDEHPDAGAIDYDHPPADAQNPLTAGANFRRVAPNCNVWLAGNEHAALLTTAVSVTSNGVHNKTTSPLAVGCNIDMVNNRAFLKFDMPSDVISSTVAKAVLRIYESQSPDGSSGSITLQRVASGWDDTTVPYNQSLTPGAITGFYDPANLDLYTDVDITSWVKGWLSNPSTNYGLCLYGTEGVSGTAKYFDGYYGVTAPQLIITVPEPGAIALLLTGVIGFLTHAWKKRR